MTKQDLALVWRMRKHGIVNPILTLKAARAAGLPIALACAFLEQETGGGRNVFGHDPSIFKGAGAVTKDKYLAYKKARKLTGNKQCQGVGPMQLTYWAFQDQADAQGGCWRPLINMTVGFTLAARNIKRYGKVVGIARYNGSGSAAMRYSVSVRSKQRLWEQRLGLERPVPLTLRERALRFALTQVGVHETGFNNHGPKIREYLKEVGLPEGYPWCDAFVSYCLHKVGGVHNPVESASVGSSWLAAKRLGWLVSRPLRADLVLYDFNNDGYHDDHIGFVEQVVRLGPILVLRTVEGNTSSGTGGSQTDGGGVYRRLRTVKASSVAFIRVPG